MDDKIYGKTISEIIEAALDDIQHKSILKNKDLEGMLREFIEGEGRQDITFQQVVDHGNAITGDCLRIWIADVARQHSEENDACEEYVIQKLTERYEEEDYDDVASKRTVNEAEEIAEQFFSQ